MPAFREALTRAGDPVHWLVELNLDLRNRAAVGLGAEIVRARQEEYVQRAWEQVGAVEEANRRLREAELARGELVVACQQSLRGERGYYLVSPSQDHAAVLDAFLPWLQAQAAP